MYYLYAYAAIQAEGGVADAHGSDAVDAVAALSARLQSASLLGEGLRASQLSARTRLHEDVAASLHGATFRCSDFNTHSFSHGLRRVGQKNIYNIVIHIY